MEKILENMHYVPSLLKFTLKISIFHVFSSRCASFYRALYQIIGERCTVHVRVGAVIIS